MQICRFAVFFAFPNRQTHSQTFLSPPFQVLFLFFPLSFLPFLSFSLGFLLLLLPCVLLTCKHQKSFPKQSQGENEGTNERSICTVDKNKRIFWISFSSGADYNFSPFFSKVAASGVWLYTHLVSESTLSCSEPIQHRHFVTQHLIILEPEISRSSGSDI